MRNLVLFQRALLHDVAPAEADGEALRGRRGRERLPLRRALACGRSDSKTPEFLLPNGIFAGHDFEPWYSDVMYASISAAASARVGDVHLGSDSIVWFRPYQ